MTKRGYIGSRLRVGRFGLTQGSVDGFPARPQGARFRSPGFRRLPSLFAGPGPL